MSTTDMFDAIQRPAHYASGDVECIDAIKASMSDIEYVGYCKGNVMKYLWRYRLKDNPNQDIGKALFYLNEIERILRHE